MLEVKSLTAGYEKKRVLFGLDFKVSAGDFVGIIGPNGSGKTTLLRVLSGVIKPETGGVYLESRDLTQIDLKDLARKVAVVSQMVNAEGMTVEEFVLFGRIPHFRRMQFLETESDLKVVRESMLKTDVFEFRGQRMDRISGGERQLAMIARALAQEPELLLLDEPTTHLDITHQVKILDLIKRLNRNMGITVIMVLHDLNLASEYCQRLILINRGRVHKMGSPQEVLDYRTIEDVYETVVVVNKNPISSCPNVLVVSEEQREKQKKQ